MEKTISVYIPERLSELNIANVMVFNKAMKMEGLSNQERLFQIIANLNNLDVKDVRRLPISQVEEVGEKILNVFYNMDVTEHDNLDNLRIITIEGEEYGLEPSFEKMETGAYMDITGLLQNIDDNLHKLMAILYRPIKRKYGKLYELTPYSTERDEIKEEREKMFLSRMPYNIVRAVVNFYMVAYQKMTEAFNNSLMSPPKIGRITPSNEVAAFGWYNSIYVLSGGDFLKRTEVLLQPIDESLAFLVYNNVRNYDEAVTHQRINNSR